MMDARKLGNRRQIQSVYEVRFTSGRECGKEAVIVHNGDTEVMLSKDNALDIVYLKYKGVNISFMSKNGQNDGLGDFATNFEGGFLYTCGADNVSSCVPGKPIHGSLHYTRAENVNIIQSEDCVIVSGTVRECGLFLKNLIIQREFKIYNNGVSVCDTVLNGGYTETEYVLLYHTNFGYPFLDECLQMEIPAAESVPLTEIARRRQKEMFRITPPADGGTEDVYYHFLKEGNIRLRNTELGIACNMLYDVRSFPVTLEWKSMISGDYALGIEPSLTRFDDFKMRTLQPQQNETYKITIKFSKEEG